MSDFPEEEPDPEMAADDEENAPGLVELLEEIVENEEREELEGLAEPDVEFDLETDLTTLICHVHSKKSAAFVSRIYPRRLYSVSFDWYLTFLVTNNFH